MCCGMGVDVVVLVVDVMERDLWCEVVVYGSDWIVFF